ncbi:putative RDD family membrane protein YckC [Pseudoduganella flava]|uniref:Putative RDD family membrane protein YckC n=1 Tax=Pseudoduganella flava TaxID=871742 RepID=A0A562PG41_9BURK|nr:RDD family protein [Pseudoduganella flava]QGZ38885.1 RDD family protein [Pseudoduganella flava]TWI42956.1 putative RDD family membrane protein YckC [Pseudoduganella flava]
MPANDLSPIGVPSIGRRLIAMVYELLLAFAVLFLPFLIFELAVNASHAAVVEHGRQALAFLVLGAYFIHQWSRNGQTLAMQTWRIRVTLPDGGAVPLRLAVVRYLLAWMWVLPALVASWAFGLAHWAALGALGAGIAVWSLTALFDKDGQFLHDRLAGTRLVQLPKRTKKTAATA